MSKRIGNVIIIEEEEPSVCELCDTLVEETRPYGPGGKRVCFDCAMKDKAGTERRMGEILFGDKPSN